jgi:hypothetical protein
MTTLTTKKPPQRTAAKRTAVTTTRKAKQTSTHDLPTVYSKYFTAPNSTPEMFKIFDMSEGGGISYSSHT